MTLAGGLDLSDALRAVVDRGAAFVPQALNEAFRTKIHREIERGPFEAATAEVGPVRQATEAFTVLLPSKDYPAAQALSGAFTDAVRAHRVGIRGLATYRPNELTVQRYRPGPVGITAHLDGKRFRRLIAVFTTQGSARLSLCAEREGPILEEWVMTPGSLVLLRAPGLAGHVDGRPFHAVAAPAEGVRYSVALRMNSPPQ